MPVSEGQAITSHRILRCAAVTSAGTVAALASDHILIRLAIPVAGALAFLQLVPPTFFRSLVLGAFGAFTAMTIAWLFLPYTRSRPEDISYTGTVLLYSFLSGVLVGAAYDACRRFVMWSIGRRASPVVPLKLSLRGGLIAISLLCVVLGACHFRIQPFRREDTLARRFQRCGVTLRFDYCGRPVGAFSNSRRFDRAILPSIASLPTLEALNLCGTGVTDTDLSQLCTLAELKHLNISSTGITDQGVTHLRSLPAIRYIDVCVTRVPPDGVSSLATIPSLETIRLDPQMWPSGEIQADVRLTSVAEAFPY